ncbi:MAG TPA: cupredoxin family copper-binding protein [Candidatus Udaeobacter sp.]|jgi:plastocyanin|nr:cupredoxin family copper-binding protein [Candidatus Udaeobacter sp.]
MRIRKHLWPLCAMMGILLTSPFTLAVCAHIVHAATPAKEGAKVSIANFAFGPAEITIAPGESVTWTNDDGAPHGLEYNDGEAGTDLLLPGASFSRRFDQPGTYDYNCSIHPYMTGRVVVRAQ